MTDLYPVSARHQQQLHAVTDLADVGRVVRTAARRCTGAKGATFVLREGALCFYADEDAIAPLWKGQRFPLETCISGWAMLNVATAVVPDIEKDDRIPLAAYRPTFVRSLVMVPVGRPDPVAAIGVYWSVPRPPDPAAVAALEDLAAAAGAAIERIGLDDAPWAPSFRHEPDVRDPGRLRAPTALPRAAGGPSRSAGPGSCPRRSG